MFKQSKGKKPAEIRAVIFDGGGTIWDSSEGLYESYRWGFKQLGLNLSLSPEICHHLRGLRDFNTAKGIAKALLWVSRAFACGESMLFLERPKANEYLKSKIQVYSEQNPSFPSLVMEMTQRFDEYLYNNVRDETYQLLPRAREMLKEIHKVGYQLALVTIRRALSAEGILKHHGLERYFSHILSTEGYAGGGKGPSVAEAVLCHLGLPPAQMLWVGDSAADISCAKEAGIRAVGILTGLADRQTLLDEGADWILDDLGGLATLLGLKRRI